MFASDSRITYNLTKTKGDGSKILEMGAHFSNTSPKTFLTSSKVGISYCGDSSIQNKPITGYIERFIEKHKDDDVDLIKDDVVPYFTSLENNLNSTFIIGGYKKEEVLKQKLYRVDTKSKHIEIFNTSEQGALWSGEVDVMSRILNRVFVQNDAGGYNEVVSHPILWQYFTLQDAVDFARYAVKTTIDTMNFQGRVKTVGGPIDILVIKPSEAIWIEKRQLH